MSVLIYDPVPKVPLDDFLPEITFEFTDAPQAALLHYVARAIALLCENANVLRRTVTVKGEPGARHYRLDTVDDVDIIAIMSMRHIRGCMCTGPVVRRTAPVTGCAPCFCCGPVSAWVEGTELVLSAPQPCDEFAVELSVRPAPGACEVDRKLLDEFYPAILLGVRSMMCAMVDKPWSSWERSRQAELMFRKECAEAALRTLTGRQRGSIRARLPRAF